MSERPKRKNHRLLNAVPTPAKAGAAGPFKYSFTNHGRYFNSGTQKLKVSKVLQIQSPFLVVIYKFGNFPAAIPGMPLTKPYPISREPNLQPQLPVSNSPFNLTLAISPILLAL